MQEWEINKMTRINVVPVEELCNQHLFAEWREMPRLVSYLNKAKNKTIPPEYVLGQGHIRFFYDKFYWLYKRHKAITKELLNRGYNLSHTNSDIFLEVDEENFKDWNPTQDDMVLNRMRILERMPDKPLWRVK
jgi:hypothetical protein